MESEEDNQDFSNRNSPDLNFLPFLKMYDYEIESTKKVPHLRIELESKIILVVNSSRKTAISMAQDKYGFRKFAPRLTRYTGRFGEQGILENNGELGRHLIDKELVAALCEDLDSINKGNPLFVSVDQNFEFLLQIKDYPKFAGYDVPCYSMYAVTRKDDSPQYKLEFSEMIEAYYCLLFHDDMDGIGGKFDLPSGFHLTIPLLHHGNLGKFDNFTVHRNEAKYKLANEKSWTISSDDLLPSTVISINDSISAATSFIAEIAYWPSNSVNSSEKGYRPKGTNGKEILLVYEENRTIWDTLVNSIIEEFSLPKTSDSSRESLENFDLSTPYAHDTLPRIGEETALVSFRNQLVHSPNLNDLFEEEYVHRFFYNFNSAKFFGNGLEIYDPKDITQQYFYIPKGIDAQYASELKWKIEAWHLLMREQYHRIKAKIFSLALNNASASFGSFFTEFIHFHDFTSDVSQWVMEVTSNQSAIVTGDVNTVISHGWAEQGEFDHTGGGDVSKTPLDNLTNFVMNHRGENFDEVIKELRENNHKGEDKLILIENIVAKKSRDELIELILAIVSWPDIKNQLEKVGLSKEYRLEKKLEAVSDLMTHFGYDSLKNTLPTLPFLIEKMNSFRSDRLQSNDLQAKVISLSKDIEWYLQLCIKGTLRKERKNSEVGKYMSELLDLDYYEIGKRNLGSLVNSDLPKIFDTFDLGKYPAQKLRDRFVAARNKFTHPGEDGPRISDAEVEDYAKQYFANATEFLQSLSNTKLTRPIPITITSVKETHHGYMEILCNKADGSEMIFIHPNLTNGIEVGSNLYMIAVNNPTRINPILFKF